ncbi:hypothetical protein SCLCIDRAFT_1040463 [Scleroderma citrinum Foug A]|uniref:Uncharacterized protein n=1 Tax=Scleroderma citrinum Foug A TaxID=1036808 RepID=A0A0C3DSH9_9AGAM|nr:hypothetical protein SCLCIDRAFT_1040463 [Scleroderma citrinum Foug A]
MVLRGISSSVRRYEHYYMLTVGVHLFMQPIPVPPSCVIALPCIDLGPPSRDQRPGSCRRLPIPQSKLMHLIISDLPKEQQAQTNIVENIRRVWDVTPGDAPTVPRIVYMYS